MAASLYVYGPAGCGKTTNAIRLKRKFGLDQIIDDYDGFGPERANVPKQGALVLGKGRHNGPPGVRAISYLDAITSPEK
jgi:hypothetical protein